MIDLKQIHKGMEVLTSDGQRLGTVRELMGNVMFLDDTVAGHEQESPSIPLIWMLKVDEAVHLAKSREQVEMEWRAGARTSL